MTGGAMDNAPGPDLLDVIRKVAADYQVFGELGRKSDTDVWFLARKGEDAPLVALRLLSRGIDQWGDPRYDVEMAKEVGASVAAGQTACDACGAPLRTFARFCGHCGADQAKGVKGGAPSVADRKLLLAEVREAASALYDVLGEMPWAGGDGVVYFALTRSTGALVRLRLRDAEAGMELGETRVGLSSTGAVTVTPMSSMPARPSASSVPLPPPAMKAPDPVVAAPPPPPPPPPPPSARPPAPKAASDEAQKIRMLTYAVIGLGVLVLIQMIIVLFR